jgi:acetyltransferase-like isoleucine patch superfamily enzyme
MILANHKPILIIGYKESSMAQEFANAIEKTHAFDIIDPQEYWSLVNKSNFQYAVSSWLDLLQREQITNSIDQHGLDLVTYIDDTAVIGQTVSAQIGPGTFVFSFCTMSLASKVGRHCIICPYSMIGHYSTVGDGCILRPGTMVLGKSIIGNYCVFDARSTVVNGISICDHVQVKAFSTLTKNISKSGTYIGTPARLMH